MEDPMELDIDEGTLLETRRLNAREKGYQYSVKQHYPEVWRQTKNSSMAMSATHMLTILYRMKTSKKKLQLSPSGLLSKMSEQGISYMQLAEVIIEGAKGFEELVLCREVILHGATGFEELVQPREVIRIVKNGLEERDYTELLYEEVPKVVYKRIERYTVKDLYLVIGLENIINALRDNFDSQGRHYPMMALCYQMGSLEEHEVASKNTMENPYKWGDFNNLFDSINLERRKEPQQVVLITGIYIMADNPNSMEHSIEIKNSRGTEWVRKGYAWVTADIFQAIIVPVMDGD